MEKSYLRMPKSSANLLLKCGLKNISIKSEAIKGMQLCSQE